MNSFEGLIAQAIARGVETTVEELIDLAGLRDEAPLSAAAAVVERLGRYNLKLQPPTSEGRLSSRRLLRTNARTSVEQMRQQVNWLISEGESQQVEFKSSLIADMKRLENTGELHAREELVGECLKTVCAFLNTDGGHLVIGLTDSGDYSGGIERDFAVRGLNADKWSLYWKDAIRQRFYEGRKVFPYVRTELFDHGAGLIVLVDVRPRTDPSFVQRSRGGSFEFFTRVGPSTESLSMPEFYDFVRARFEL